MARKSKDSADKSPTVEAKGRKRAASSSDAPKAKRGRKSPEDSPSQVKYSDDQLVILEKANLQMKDLSERLVPLQGKFENLHDVTLPNLVGELNQTISLLTGTLGELSACQDQITTLSNIVASAAPEKEKETQGELLAESVSEAAKELVVEGEASKVPAEPAEPVPADAPRTIAA